MVPVDNRLERQGAIMAQKGDLVTGTLDLLVLKALQLGEAHGWGIMERIRTTSGDQLQVNQGSLYPVAVPAQAAGADREPAGACRRTTGARGTTR
jgi:hypothetical protein